MLTSSPPSSPSDSLVSLSSVCLLHSVLLHAQGLCLCWLCVLRLFLQGKHAPFSWVRFCHFVRAPGLTLTHTHTLEHMSKHTCQTSSDSRLKAAIIKIFVQQQWITYHLYVKNIACSDETKENFHRTLPSIQMLSSYVEVIVYPICFGPGSSFQWKFCLTVC